MTMRDLIWGTQQGVCIGDMIFLDCYSVLLTKKTKMYYNEKLKEINRKINDAKVNETRMAVYAINTR